MTGNPGNHSLAQVRATLADFNAATVERYRRVAQRQLFQFPQRDPMELVNEAALRLADGRRAWPLGTEFGAVFYNVMRSIADEWRDDEMENPVIPASDLPPASDGDTVDIEALAGESSSEAALREAEDLLAKAVEHFKDDDDVQNVIYGRLLGLTAAETQAEFAMTALDYGAARKRLERWAADVALNGGRK